MKSETRRLKYRTRIKNRTTNKFLKKGGAAGKTPLEITPEIFEKYKIRRYYTHSLILKNLFLPKIFEGCKERAILVFFINKGHNGFILQFVCNTENAIKILFNRSNPLFGFDRWQDTIRGSLEKEYTNINLFNDSAYVIKSEGYFIFDGAQFICTGKNPYNKTYSLKAAITDETYKVLPIGAEEGAAKIIEPFGGLILEYVNHSLTDIESHLQKLHAPSEEGEVRYIVHRVFNFIKLFYQYIKGIIDINSKGYIHTDIKIENLMFNNTSNIYTAKIVDLANIKHISTTWGFATNSVGAPADQYHTGALKKLDELQTHLGHRPRTVEPSSKLTAPLTPAKEAEYTKMKEAILVRYDLYSLCVTFYYILEKIKKTEFNFAIIEQGFGKKAPKEKELAKYKIFKKAFEDFDTKIKEIKYGVGANGVVKEAGAEDYKGLSTILTRPDNATLKDYILITCLRAMDKDFEKPK
jgi:serine/threonine protein kinase